MKKILNNILLFIFPLSYIAYILYIRIFMIRDPRILYVKMSYTSIIITVIVILGLLLRIYNLLKKEGIITEKPINNKILLSINNVFARFYYFISNIWHNFYTVIIRNSLKINLIILNLAKFLDDYINYKRAFIVLVIFEVLPKTILVTTFLFDIFYGQQFYYFYKVLFLLLLPLILSLLRTILLMFHHDNFEALESYITQTLVEDDAGESKIVYAFADHFEPPDYIKNIDDFIQNHFYPVANIINVIARFEITKSNYKINFMLLFILILHLLGWLTILFFGIYV